MLIHIYSTVISREIYETNFVRFEKQLSKLNEQQGNIYLLANKLCCVVDKKLNYILHGALDLQALFMQTFECQL